MNSKLNNSSKLLILIIDSNVYDKYINKNKWNDALEE